MRGDSMRCRNCPYEIEDLTLRTEMHNWYIVNNQMTEEEMKLISERINKQEGRKYPCSNQIVVCGFFSTDEEWNNFVNNNLDKIKTRKKDRVIFANKEQWYHFNYINYSQRGYRFYKIKVSHNVNRELFLNCIYPYCLLYCKKIEWI